MICFRTGYRDALIMADEFEQTYRPSQLVELGRFQVFARLMESGVQQAPVRLRTHPPVERVFSEPEKLIRASRERFGMKQAVIEEKLERWLRSK